MTWTIKFEVEEIQLANKYEALAWICKNQLGRRNLSPERKKFLLGKEYKGKAAATGSIMLCELQGATEEFIFRWNVIFQEHPDVLTDKTCRKTIFELLDRITNYLKTIKEEKL